MQVYSEISPYEFLMDRSWECDSLKAAINNAGISDLDFDDVVEEMLALNIISETGLNDFFRFNEEQILFVLGINDEE